MASTYNVFVTGGFYSGKTTMLKSLGYWHYSMRTKAYFRTTSPFELQAHTEFASVLVGQKVLVNLFTHTSTQSWENFWDQFGFQIDGVIVLVDVPGCHEAAQKEGRGFRARVEESQYILNLYRRSMQARFIVAANKVDAFPGKPRQAVAYCREVLDIQPQEVVVPSVTSNLRSVRATIASLVLYLRSH